MLSVGIGFAVVSLAFLLRELRRAPEAFEDTDGLTLVQPKLNKALRRRHSIRSAWAEILS